jgi:hypothetical protein
MAMLLFCCPWRSHVGLIPRTLAAKRAPSLSAAATCIATWNMPHMHGFGCPLESPAT